MATPSMNADQGDDMWQSRCFVLIIYAKKVEKSQQILQGTKVGGGGWTAPLIIYSHLGCMIFLSYYHHHSTSTLICLSQCIHQSAEEMAKSSLSIQVSFSPKSRSRVRVGHWIDF